MNSLKENLKRLQTNKLSQITLKVICSFSGIIFVSCGLFHIPSILLWPARLWCILEGLALLIYSYKSPKKNFYIALFISSLCVLQSIPIWLIVHMFNRLKFIEFTPGFDLLYLPLCAISLITFLCCLSFEVYKLMVRKTKGIEEDVNNLVKPEIMSSGTNYTDYMMSNNYIYNKYYDDEASVPISAYSTSASI